MIRTFYFIWHAKKKIRKKYFVEFLQYFIRIHNWISHLSPSPLLTSPKANNTLPNTFATFVYSIINQNLFPHPIKDHHFHSNDSWL